MRRRSRLLVAILLAWALPACVATPIQLPFTDTAAGRGDLVYDNRDLAPTKVVPDMGTSWFADDGMVDGGVADLATDAVVASDGQLSGDLTEMGVGGDAAIPADDAELPDDGSPDPGED